MTVFVAIGASGAKGAAGGAALVLATGENSLSSESSMPMQARAALAASLERLRKR